MGKKGATSGLTVDVLSSLSDVEELRPEWAELAVTAGSSVVGLPEVALAWWRHLGRGELLVATVRDRSGRLVAVAPLHERRYGGVPIVRWLGHGLGSVASVLLAPGGEAAAAPLWSAIANGRRVLQLLEYRHDGGGLLSLRRSDDWATDIRVTDRCPTISLASLRCGCCHGTGPPAAHGAAAEGLAPGEGEPAAIPTCRGLEPFLAARRNLRHMLARGDRKVEATGEAFEVAALSTPEHILAVLEEVTELYGRAERARPRQHLLADPYREFTVDAVIGAARQGRAVLFTGRLGPRLVCFDVAFRTGSVLSCWLGRLDPDFLELTPGHLSLRAIVSWSIAAGLDVVDLLVGDNGYKARWCTGGYDTCSVVAAPQGRLRVARAGIGGLATAHSVASRARANVGQLVAGGPLR